MPKNSPVASVMPCLCRLLVMLLTLSVPARAHAEPLDAPAEALDVRSAILYDCNRDVVLFEQNADQPIPPASLTKVMSMFLALDQVSADLLRMDDTTVVSRNAAATGGSRMGLREGERVTLERLLMGMAVSSGNDASHAVAELAGGSVQSFVNMMNAKARLLHMHNTVFLNPHGLPARGQQTTARDMLSLARAYLRAHPGALHFHNSHTLLHNGRLTWNKNPLLGQYPGADGLKTGWVRASGHNLIFTASRGDRRLLAVILGAPDAETRGIEAFRLLDAGFAVGAGQAATVADALEALPRQSYAPDFHLLAREARELHPGYASAGGGVRKAHRGRVAQRRMAQTASRGRHASRGKATRQGRHAQGDRSRAAERSTRHAQTRRDRGRTAERASRHAAARHSG